MSDTRPHLLDMETRLPGITKGPWHRHETIHADNFVLSGLSGGLLTSIVIAGPTYERANTEFIAEARQFVPAAVEALKGIAAMHKPDYTDGGRCVNCEMSWPCQTIRMVTNHIALEA